MFFYLTLNDINQRVNNKETSSNDLAILIKHCDHQLNDVVSHIIVEVPLVLGNQYLYESSKIVLETFLLFLVKLFKRKVNWVQRFGKLVQYSYKNL
jgi:citrate lyase synthetase